MINPNSINGYVIDANFNLVDTGCDGWLKTETEYEDAGLIFNNCPIGQVGGEFSDFIPAGVLILYDYTKGPISSPPACLDLNVSEANNFVIVKTYPNPADSFLQIASEINFENIQIYSSDGKKVKNRFYLEIKLIFQI